MTLNSTANELAKTRLADDGQPLRKEASDVSVDELHRASLKLTNDDRLRLVVQLWKSLPAEHRSALLTLQSEDVSRSENLPAELIASAPKSSRTSALRKWLFDPSHTSDLYSAPRRFDLATIFVVTAAYSLLLGGLTAMGWPPSAKIMISLLAAAIAVTQALFRAVANPRGVSVLTGAVVSALFIWAAYLLDTFSGLRPSRFSLLVWTVLFGGLLGGFIGYLVGTCVGGVFLVADMVRGKFERREVNDGGDSSPLDTIDTVERAAHE